MQLFLAFLSFGALGLALSGVIWRLHAAMQESAMGDVPGWDAQRADKATADTERWFGRSWESARLVEPWALTTREWQRLADEAIVAEREERAREMDRRRFKRAG